MKKRKAFEWSFLIVFVLADIGLLWLAKTYWFDKRDGSPQTPPSLRANQEEGILGELEKVARSGSWEALETAKERTQQEFEKGGKKPSRGLALYFFPQNLPEQSLERTFAENELKPGIDSLKKAHESGQTNDADFAYALLKNRVVNYEAGASAGEDILSDDARSFLSVYSAVSGRR